MNRNCAVVFHGIWRTQGTIRSLINKPDTEVIQQGDLHALTLLCHFYRAVRMLLPLEECWWAHRHAATSEPNLKEWLTGSMKQVEAQHEFPIPDLLYLGSSAPGPIHGLESAPSDSGYRFNPTTPP
ncbi:hypothetical protein F5Y04DRAFT_58287 [Hypomontagnella monticulosa]|nr:hypothetical protein F5Y04DRAFT_58287 [Hypomontagnella monticulosa]